MKENKKFRTESLRLATFLFCKEQKVVGINPSIKDRNKYEVVFIRTPELDELVEIYNFGSKKDFDRHVDPVEYEQVRQDFLEKFNEVNNW